MIYDYGNQKRRVDEDSEEGVAGEAVGEVLDADEDEEELTAGVDNEGDESAWE